jgi:hypothetical protein
MSPHHREDRNLILEGLFTERDERRARIEGHPGAAHRLDVRPIRAGHPLLGNPNRALPDDRPALDVQELDTAIAEQEAAIRATRVRLRFI